MQVQKQACKNNVPSVTVLITLRFDSVGKSAAGFRHADTRKEIASSLEDNNHQVAHCFTGDKSLGSFVTTCKYYFF